MALKKEEMNTKDEEERKHAGEEENNWKITGLILQFFFTLCKNFTLIPKIILLLIKIITIILSFLKIIPTTQ